MIDERDIFQSLNELNAAYNNPLSINAYFCSKLAIIELCGWVEISLDTLLQDYALINIHNELSHKLAEQYIKKVHSFNYNKHFQPLLVQFIGLVNLEKFLKGIDASTHQASVSELETLLTRRNSLAHTYVQGTTTTIDAPSVTIARFKKILSAFQNYESVLKDIHS